MYSHRNSGPPAWFVFVLGIALVFGAYYLWLGVQAYVRSGGLGIQEATQMAATISTATAERVMEIQTRAPTARPTSTPLPPCQEFVVSVPSAIVRTEPSTNSDIVESLPEGSTVCVIAREGDSEWFLIDRNQETQRLERAFMHEDIIRPVNPTPTASATFTPLPSVTPTYTWTPSETPTRGPSSTPDLNATSTPTPTSTPSPTPNQVSV